MTHKNIERNIRLTCFFHVLFSIIPIILILLIVEKASYKSIFFPEKIYMEKANTLESLEPKTELISNYYNITFPKLQYTGYDLMSGSKAKGSYYYYITDATCIFVLVDSKNIGSNKQILIDYTMKCRIVHYDELFKHTINSYASDINWTTEGIYNTSVGYLVSEPAYKLTRYLLTFAILVIIGLICLYILVTNLLFLVFPLQLHPKYRFLKCCSTQSLKELLSDVDKDCNADSSIVCGHTVITDRYIVNISLLNSSIIPLDNLIWVYSHQQLQRILWFNINIFSSMTFVSKSGKKIYISRKPAHEARQIYSYLESTYPDMLLKYSKHNRLIAKEYIKAYKKDKVSAN